MTSSNTYGRQIVVPLTNKSGGGVIAGDVVIVDTTNNDAFTTTTSAATTNIVGVAQQTIASNDTGRVCLGGYAALVLTSGSVTRGNYGATHTVAKQAADVGSSRVAGAFCKFLTGGTTPDAIVYNPDLGGASLTNPMTTAGDIIVGGASGAPARLAAGTAGYPLQGGGAGVASAYGILASGSYTDSSTGDYTTTSTSFADIDGTNLKFTITTGARRVLIILTGTCLQSSAGSTIYFDFDIDGTRVSGGSAGLWEQNINANFVGFSISFLTVALSAGSHTIKAQWRVDATTGTLKRSGGKAAHMAVVEQFAV